MRLWRIVPFSAVLWCAFIASRAQGPPATPPEQDGMAELAAGRSALAHGQWPQAEHLFQHYLSGHQASSEGHSLLAFTFFHENRPTESLAEYTHAAHLAPLSALDFRYVALNYVLLKDYADADKWITRSVQENGGEGESWYAMGRIKYTENRFGEAVESFRKALACMPQSVKAENNLGLALEGLNKPEEAIRAYRQAIDWQKDDAHPSEQPLLNLGILLSDRNEFKEALPLLTEAATLAPGDSKVHAMLGKLYRRENAWPQAQAEFEQALVKKPDDAALHFQLAQVYQREGLQTQAKVELAKVAALNGTHSSSSP